MKQSYKQCGTCHRYHHVDNFYAQTNSPTYSTECRSCRNIRTTNWKSDNMYQKQSVEQSEGTVYILTNALHANWFRVGRTSNSLRSRMNMHRTSTPFPDSMKYVMSFESKYSKRLENMLLDILSTHPDTAQRTNDWFNIDKAILTDIFNEVTQNEEASLRHRDQQPSQSHLVLCN